ncbi:MAG: hypothetical protein IPH72_27255 [Sandaracinaceae bacterium]|nr:hypothetical protein [Sandaracinaceae bacterium]
MVKVPIIGKQMEQKLVATIEESYGQTAELALEMLKERAAGRWRLVMRTHPTPAGMSWSGRAAGWRALAVVIQLGAVVAVIAGSGVAQAQGAGT